MLEIRNVTPFAVAISPGLDADGREFATVPIKGTFDLADVSKGSEELRTADEQTPILAATEYFGAVGISSVKYESDLLPAKNGTDVVLIGCAHAADRATSVLDVGLQVGRLVKTIRVFGNRRWSRTFGTPRLSTPERFESTPLVYERAYGGMDHSRREGWKLRWEERNPVGVGFTTATRADNIDDLPVPNLEDPANLISRPSDRPPPAAFGFVAPHWEPRKSWVGTYDAAWERDRKPLLPVDFDARHHRSAHADLCASSHLQGGEPVRLTNACRAGELRFRLPRLAFQVEAMVKGRRVPAEPRLDTVTIEPDEQRVTVVWKATVPCARAFLLIDHVSVKQLDRGA